ncbi:MAG: ATP-binding protein [candidate division KSB1 bacterium]|nr:ATP-binding protein [candidate division KSB1 bacterium]MDZ7274687.1 ATP-binding protein [candidate division KSB1 bacterium]MDZ7285512.1 ATP-binding protein [candidate division KSB1 bacterium]MDZ7298544.1 ATP-binding protein [candidate division KSB1 bacterium]MDZ7306604.1 ATP-binding protein [candidate division KSB1 bacterium]
MKRLRSKFILTFLLLTLLPAVAVAWFARDLLDKALAIGLQSQTAEGLNAALAAVQQLTQQQRASLARDLQQLAQALRHAQSARQWSPHPAHRMVLYDCRGNRVRHWPAHTTLSDLPPPPTPPPPRDSLSEAGSDSLAIRLALALGDSLLLVGERRVPEALRRQTLAVLRAAQFFNIIDLEKANLQRSLIAVFLTVYAPVLLLSVGLGWYLAARITAPLQDLGEAARRIAQGDWQYRVPVRSRDEVGAMGHAFNTMVEDLRRQQDQVIALEKMAAWREIARVLAHEIKNPLTPIQLLVQQIQDEYRGQEENYRATLRESSTIINQEIEKLRRLVREFSDFARLPDLHPAPAQLNDLIREVARLYSQRTVRVELDQELPLLTFDWEGMRRVLLNLLENALQSSPQAEVAIRTRRVENQVEMSVADTGPGIAAENLPRIFEPYFSTKKSGMGLGLAIVKQIVTEHGGNLTVTSTVGRGTSFQVRLPCPAPESPN